MTSNQTILSFDKVQHASYFYRNQYGHERRLKPTHTYLNQTIHNPPPNKVGVLDRWHEVVSFQLTANHTIEYTREKAVSMWAAWKARIFGQLTNKRKK